MKTLLVLFALLAYIPLSAQNSIPADLAIDKSTGLYATSGILQFDSKPQLLLMEGAYKWMNDIKFGNTLGSKGISMEESVFARIIVSQYFMSLPSTYNSKVRYTLVLEFKDGKVRYRFSDFCYLAVTKRKEFENPVTDSDKLLVKNMLNESNAYVRNFIYELTAWLENYQQNSNW
jgi:hypothetical protein